MGFNIFKSSENNMLNIEKTNRNVYFFFLNFSYYLFNDIMFYKCCLFIQNFGKIVVKNCKQTIY